MLRNVKKAVVIAAGVALGFGLLADAQALPFGKIKQVYFFGDSLTDSGFYNLVTSYPHKAPTFTTLYGYTYSQYIARDIKNFELPKYPPPPTDTITNNSIGATLYSTPILHGIDYAAGGSTTNGIGNGFPFAPSLHSQVSYFLDTMPRQLDPDAVYFIWSGANDLLILLDPAHFPSDYQLTHAAVTAAYNIGQEVQRLSARGARWFVVMSLPNIGFTPLIDFYTVAANMPTLPAAMKNLTFTFNSALNVQLGIAKQRYGTKILYIDVYDLLDEIIQLTKQGKSYTVRGHTFKFTNYNEPACGFMGPPEDGDFVSALECDAVGDGYIFADDVHPTGEAHRLLALYVEEQILKWNVGV